MNSQIHRPVGLVITTVATLLVALGMLAFLLMIPGNIRDTDPLLVVLIVAFAAFAILWMTLAYGLWTFQTWAIKFGKILYSIGIIQNLFNFFIESSNSSFVTGMLAIAINASMLLYVTRPHVVRLFEQPSRRGTISVDKERNLTS